MDQVRECRGGLPEGDVGKRFVWSRYDAMVGGAGVRDDLDIALGHVAADTVVGRFSLHTGRDGQLAALVGVTGEAFACEIHRGFLAGQLNMWIVAGNAAHAARACAVAFAQSHGIVVLDMVRRRW